MSEMSKVEEVARAICAENCEDYDMLPSIHKSVARAAIEALRKPTEAMIEAGNEQERYDEGSAGAELHWQVMIDAALKE
jgi:hypothetical protein